MSKNKKVVFIDRDGVINKDPGGWTEHNYVTRWKDFHFLPGAKKAVRMLTKAGYDIIIISNQAGISKGYYTEAQLDAIDGRMVEELKRSGGAISKTFYCIHQDSDRCDCRKPKVGLFKQAERKFGITADGHYFIGDGRTDIEAGKKAGLDAILVLSGKTDLKEIVNWAVKPDFIFKDLSKAVTFILKGDFK